MDQETDLQTDFSQIPEWIIEQLLLEEMLPRPTGKELLFSSCWELEQIVENR